MEVIGCERKKKNSKGKRESIDSEKAGSELTLKVMYI
jgi:hypothetical protein